MHWQTGEPAAPDIPDPGSEVPAPDADGCRDFTPFPSRGIASSRPARALWVGPGAQEVPARVDRPLVALQVCPVELPEEGLFVTLEFFQDGRRLGAVRLKGLGALREIPLRIRLEDSRRGRPGVLRVRSNAKLRLVF